ncbi:MAG: ABC transporter substrate-binding protein [Rubritepida sp.]|jgi:ABC-type nitrate/sulfonate/bicarbonate transport system substrate-binding protein|nr:ABC transporter substrate-binding protein [Rubritepida sp.]MCU0944789.1 ABC transporter substrate-binding protein [Rubritepida sp.]
MILSSRRGVLLGGASLLATPAVLRAQTATVRLTLPWLAQGATAYAYIAREMGAFSRRGLNVEVSRGFGSVAAAQALSQGQFDYAIVGAGPMILAAARALPIVGMATVNYDMTMGIALRADSPIRTAKDLEGKRIGAVPTSAEFPFWPAFARRAGINLSSITIQQMDNRVLERSLIDRQVDAITAIGSSTIPVMQAQNAPHRFILYATAGINFYANVICTRAEVLQSRPAQAEAITDALLEAAAFQLREPERAVDMFVRQVPEIGLTAGGRENARLSQGIMQWTMLADEAINNGLGWTDMAKWNAMTDLVMEFGAPADARRPSTEAIISNRFAGRIKLSAADWAAQRQRLAPFGQMLG